MNFLEEKIISDGVIKEGNILKVNNFLNHQIDIVKQAGADVSVWASLSKRGSRGAASFSARRESIAIIDDMDLETQTIHFRDNR